MPWEYRGYELFGNKTFPFTLERPAKPIKTTLFGLKKKKHLVWIELKAVKAVLMGDPPTVFEGSDGPSS